MARFLFDPSLIPALSTTGVILSGAKLYAYAAGTSTPISTYNAASGGSANSVPVEADSAGRFGPVYLDADVQTRIKVTDATGSDILYDRSPVNTALPTDVALYSRLNDNDGATFIGTTDGNSVQYHLDQAPALGIGLFSSFVGTPPNIPVTVIQVYSSGYSSNGIGIARYIYDAAVNAAYVVTWPRSSFLAADGRGFRIDARQQLHIEMFGGKCDTPVGLFTYTAPAFTATRSITPGTDNLAPLYEAIKVGGGYISSTYRKGQPIYCLGGNEANAYYFSDTIDPPHATHLIGNSSGLYLMGGTVFLFPANKGGIKLLSAGAGGRTYSSHGSTIEGIYFFGSGGSTRTCHGLQMRAQCIVRDCCFEAFAGDGINNVASGSVSTSDSTYGATYSSHLQRIALRQSGNWGMYTGGSDSSASLFHDIQSQGSRLGGIFDNSYFGNTYIAPEIDDHGDGFKGQVHHTGRLYSLIDPTAGIGASTTPGTNNRIWYDRGAGSISTAFPDWSGAGSYEMSSPIGGDPSGYAPNVIINPYVEGSGPMSLGRGAVVIGGQGGTTRYTHHLQGGSSTTSLNTPVGVGAYTPYAPDHSTLGSYFKSEIGAADGEILAHGHATDGAPFKWQHTGPDSYYTWGGQGSGSPTIWKITGQNTAEQLGTGTAQGHVFIPVNFALSDTGSTYRRFKLGTAAPTTGAHAKGEHVKNSSSTVGQPKGWDCSVSGTPGTWVSTGNL